MRYCLLLLCLCQLPVVAAEEVVRLVLNDWSSQRVLSQVTGRLVARLGYPVAYVELHVDRQVGALARDLVQIQMEAWQGPVDRELNTSLANGLVLDAGEHAARTREDWWYPDYVASLCPGLPDWRALLNCAAVFQSADTGGLGRYLAGPWEYTDSQRIRALGLPFKPVRAKTMAELWQALKQAQAEGRAILLLNWSPNWVQSVYPGHFVEFPTYHPDCEAKPEWGLNPQALYDCGNPKDGWLKKLVSNALPSRAPCVYQLVQAISLNSQHLTEMAALVDYQGLDEQQAADRWLDQYPEIWRAWLPDNCPVSQ